VRNARYGVYTIRTVDRTLKPGERYALHKIKTVGVYKKTANPRNTLPHSAARLRPALGTNKPDAAPPWLDELGAPVEPASPKPVLGILEVRLAVALAVESVGMEVLPR
jgi:hypothetical protein